MLDWRQENNLWYCYKDNNKLVSQWVQDENDKWYYLEKDGRMVTGFFQTATDNDFWFYAYPQQTEKDGETHYTGEMAIGWIQDTNEDWYYLYPERVTNYGIEYPTGAMAIDWVKLGDKSKWYYLLKEKTEYNGNTHYKGACVCNTTLEINGQNYTFDGNGVLQSNLCNGDSLISDSLVEFTGGFEGFYSKAYYDPYYGVNVKQYWTIGYGTCYCAIPEAFPDGLDSTCTQEQALEWLKQEMNVVANKIKDALGDKYNSISQQAFDCLCDIGYNAGTGSLIGGNTWNAIINGDEDNIKTFIMQWCHANSQSSSGLYKRCAGRVKMVLFGDYSARP